jgi:restriction endonuclease S subunit
MNWKTVALGDICEFTRGLTYSEIDEVEFSNNAVLRATPVKWSDFAV